MGLRSTSCAHTQLAIRWPSPPSHLPRPPFPADLPQFRALHDACFPLRYERSFFQSAVQGRDGLLSWAAFAPAADGEDAETGGEQRLVGFLIACIHWASGLERREADALLPCVAASTARDPPLLYILTLGVDEVGWCRLPGRRERPDRVVAPCGLRDPGFP